MGNRVAVIDGIRTPFVKSWTDYYDLMGWEIGRCAVKGLLAKTGISGRAVDHVIMGSVAPDIATTNIARETALGAGLPDSIPAHTCTVACISANMAITNGANLISSGNADVVIAGGVETFSDPDIKISKKYRRFLLDMNMAVKPKTIGGKLKLLKKMKLLDFIVPQEPAVSEYATGLIMGKNADMLAGRLGISQKEQDEYAEMSHARAVSAAERGVLDTEIIPVVVPGKEEAVIRDNGPRKDAKAEKLATLKPVFTKKYGSVTAGNSSFLTDGASAVLLMSESKAQELGLKPLAYIKSYEYTARNLDKELLLGPAYSISGALDKAGLDLKDIGVLEIHEAFAVQMLANMRCLESKEFASKNLDKNKKIGEVDLNKVNAYGGSLSLGHPFGATGGRLLTTCCNRLKDTGEQFGLIAGCAAGAVGNAIILENAG